MDFKALEAEKKKISDLCKEFEEVKREKHEKEAIASRGIAATEEELLDRIDRTRKATKFLLGMLPKMDKTDRKRLARACTPAGSYNRR